MKPHLIFTLFIVLAVQADAQNTNNADKEYVCNNGQVHFFSSTPIQNIDAISNTAVCAFNTATRKVSAKVTMESFEFKRKKMQDDFNEDYMESGKYPFGVLDAVITDKTDFTKDGVYNVTLKGTFEVHGVKKETEIKGKLTIKNGQPSNATAVFNVVLADYNIKIPTLVIAKVATVIKVDVNFDFRKYQGNI